MNSIIEARELTLKYLRPLLENHGYIFKVDKSKQAIVRQKCIDGLNTIGWDFLNYNPTFKIRYGVNKINHCVNNILKQLQELVTLQYKEDKNSRLLYLSYNTINNPENTTYLPDMVTEADVQHCVALMIDFLEGTAFPLLEKFDDLREIDKIINGEEPWVTDWHKPFTFVSNFRLKRLIIAKLAGNPNYENLVDLNYKQDEALASQNGYNFINDRGDLTKPIPTLVKLLEDVRPIF
jgi:hypothetical protein